MSINNGNSMKVMVDSEGVTYAHKQWKLLESKKANLPIFQSTKTSLKSPNEAISIFLEYLNSKNNFELGLLGEELKVSSIELVYSYATSENEEYFEPVWEITCENGVAAHVNAESGKIVCDQFDD